MITQKMTFVACVAALSATVFASTANASDCSEMTSNQLLAAIERGTCEVQAASVQNSTKIIVEDEYIRTSRNAGDRGANGGKAGGGYGY
jgi:hypothetical protein